MIKNYPDNKTSTSAALDRIAKVTISCGSEEHMFCNIELTGNALYELPIINYASLSGISPVWSGYPGHDWSLVEYPAFLFVYYEGEDPYTHHIGDPMNTCIELEQKLHDLIHDN